MKIEEFPKLPDEFSQVQEFEVRPNIELNVLPNEFHKETEFDYEQEFNSNIITDDQSTSSKVGSLKTQYSKILKILKLATTVSLAATTTTVALPKIVPIITVDATEEKTEETEEENKETNIIEMLTGDWSVSERKSVIIVDGEETDYEDESTTIISFAIEYDDEDLYLSTYEDGELINTSLLNKEEDGSYTCHITKQSGDEIDVSVVTDNENITITQTGKVTIDDETYDLVTYYYCTKGKTEYNVEPSEEENTIVEETCPDCDGTGEVTCSTCEGKGLIECETCNGTGYLEEDCTICEGTGKCINCSGTGTVTTTTIDEESGEETQNEETCPECNGTGLCASCEGLGKARCSTCDADGTNTNPGYISCDTCSGTGKVTCEKCNGTGKIEVEETENSDSTDESNEETTTDNVEENIEPETNE